MEVFVVTIIAVLLLLLLKQVIEPLHPLIYIIFFFIIFSFLLSSIVLPFANKLLNLLPNLPFSKQLVYSAVLYLIGDLVKRLLEELDYDALGSLIQTAIRIVILTYWLKELSSILDQLKPFLEWLQ